MTTLLIIVEQALLHMPLMLGAYLSISLMKVPDLSIESAYVFGAILGAQTVVFTSGFPLIISLVLAVGVSLIGGCTVGVISSLLSTKAGLPHLLSSIVTIGLFHGINQAVLNGSYLSLSTYANPLTISALMPENPELLTLALLAGILVISGALVLHTQLGYSLAVFGDNPGFFVNYAISQRYVFCTGIIISNALAGLSGYLFAQSNGFVETGMGISKPLLCISTLIMGKTVLHLYHRMSIFVPLVGCVAYFSLQQFLLKVGFNLKY